MKQLPYKFWGLKKCLACKTRIANIKFGLDHYLCPICYEELINKNPSLECETCHQKKPWHEFFGDRSRSVARYGLGRFCLECRPEKKRKIMKKQYYYPVNNIDDHLPYNILILEDDPNDSRMKKFNRIFSKVGARIIWVDTAQECIEELEKNQNFDLILLDNDLGGEVFVDLSVDNSGCGVARWMKENLSCWKDSTIIIHSFNPSGADYIYNLLHPHACQIMKYPGAWDNINLLEPKRE